MDIGPPLKPLYFYSEDEVQELVDSEYLCSLLAPLPPSLLCEIVASPVEHSLGEAKDVNNSPQIIHTKVVWPFGSDDHAVDKVLLLDLAKMIPIWGNNDTHPCLSPLRFLEASKNLLEALKLLGKTPTVPEPTGVLTSTSTNHAIEYEKHLKFFQQVENFEDSYLLWYKFEREAHLDILMANILFNWQKYALQVDVILQSHRALAEDHKQSYEVKFSRTSSIVDVPSQRSLLKQTPNLFWESSPVCLLSGSADHGGSVYWANTLRLITVYTNTEHQEEHEA
ncbi:hypothetical protein C0993_002905 [Termitomyces sp. T159_Od127]|nr:hypothetical protein C0993_002905 [Termitomyces sp. T159_Od127]